MSFVSDLVKRTQDLFNSGQHAVGQGFSNLGSNVRQGINQTPPINNAIVHLGQSGLGHIATGQTQIPQINLEQFNHIQNPIGHFAVGAGLGMADSLFNTPRNLVQAPINIARDVNANDRNVKHYLGDIAPFAEGMFNIGTLGGGTVVKGIAKQGIKQAGKQVLKQTIKQGAKTGAKYGGAYGALTGLEAGRNTQDNADYAKSLIANTAIGAASGGLLGGATAGVGYGFGKLFGKVENAVVKTHPGISKAEATQKANLYVRDRLGQYAGLAPKGSFKTSGLKQKVSTPDQGIKVTHWMDKVDKELGIDPKSSQEGKINFFATIGGKGEKPNKLNQGKISSNALSSDVANAKVKIGETKGQQDLRSLQQNQDSRMLQSDNQQLINKKKQSILSNDLSSNSSIPQGVNGQGYNPTGRIPVGQSGNQTATNELSGGIPFQLPIGEQLAQAGQDIQAGNQTNPIASSSLPKSISQDVNSVLRGASTKEKKLVTSMKSSTKYPPEVSQALEGTYVPITNKDTVTIAKKAVYADPKAAEARALSPQNAVDQAIGAELFNKHMADGNMQKANEIINATSGTTQGQMVQILSQYDKTTPAGAVKFAQTTINTYNKTHPNSPLSLDSATVKSLFDKATAIQKMPQGRERNILSNNLMEQVNALIPTSIADKAIAVWKAGLLTSLRTHERNFIGNAIHGAAEFAKDIPAVAADKAMSLATGKRSLTLTAKGTATGTIKGLRAGKDIVTTGYDPEQAISKYDIKKITWGNNPIEQGLKAYTESVFRTLSAGDKPFYSASFARSLYNQAGAAAINAGKRGDKAFIQKLVNDPTSQMKAIATKEAEVATFKNQNAISKAASGLKKHAGPLGDVVAPFTGVPSSVAGQIVAYSPIGLIKGIATAGRVVAGQVPDLQRQAAQEVGRGVIGTGLVGLGAYLTSKGLMTGQPKDANESRQWQLEGKQPNSILIGGKWLSINSIGPEAIVILAGSKAQQELSPSGGGASALAAGVGKDFLSQTFLQGVQGPLNAVTDPARYAQQYIQGQTASVIPNIVKDSAKALDATARQTNSIPDALKSGIPGLRNTLLPQRDAFGQPVAQQPTGAASFLDLFNSKQPVTNDPVVNELTRLDSTGNSALPSKMDKKQTVYGKQIVLTPKQLDQTMSQLGPKVKQQFSDLISSPAYQQLDDKQKAQVLSNAASGLQNNDMILNQVINGNNSSSGVVPMVNSQGAQTSSISSTPSLDKYQLQAAKDAFANGTDNFKDLGAIVLRKDASGTVTAMTKDAFNTAVYEGQMTQDKTAKNLDSYVQHGNALAKLYQTQLNDPNIDQLDKLQIGNKLTALQATLDKYQGYGGFAKGKKGKKIGTIRAAKVGSVKTFKLSKTKAPKFKIAKTPTFKVSKSKKATVTAYKSKPFKIKTSKNFSLTA